MCIEKKLSELQPYFFFMEDIQLCMQDEFTFFPLIFKCPQPPNIPPVCFLVFMICFLQYVNVFPAVRKRVSCST